MFEDEPAELPYDSGRAGAGMMAESAEGELVDGHRFRAGVRLTSPVGEILER